jgi:hypothetical protein
MVAAADGSELCRMIDDASLGHLFAMPPGRQHGCAVRLLLEVLL